MFLFIFYTLTRKKSWKNKSDSDEKNNIIDNSFSINETTLTNYIRNRIPSLHKEKRDEYLKECKHPTLRSALTKLVTEYQNIAQKSQIEVFSHSTLSKSNMKMHENSARFIESLLKTVV